MRGIVALLGLASACSFHTVAATGDGAGARDGVGGSGSDASGSSKHDAPVDAESGSVCSNKSPGDRVCLDASHSGSCNSMLVPVIDRACPTGSACSGGYCQPPSGAAMCSKASDCGTGKVCDLYVVGGSLQGDCTDPVGTQGTYANCSAVGAGNDPSCQTGICAVDGQDGSHVECLVPCVNGMDNTCPSGNSCHTVGQPTTIEGVSTQSPTQYGCFS